MGAKMKMKLSDKRKPIELERKRAYNVIMGRTWNGMSHKKEKSGRQHSGRRNRPVKTRWGTSVVAELGARSRRAL